MALRRAEEEKLAKEKKEVASDDGSLSLIALKKVKGTGIGALAILQPIVMVAEGVAKIGKVLAGSDVRHTTPLHHPLPLPRSHFLCS